MNELVIAPLLVALVSAVVTLALGRFPTIQRSVSVLGVTGYAATVAWAIVAIILVPGAPGAEVYQVGGWPAPFGITLVLDGLSAFMLAIAAVVGASSLLFSVFFEDRDNQRVYYHPLFHFLLVGVTGAFLTGDLFNLFVWFEVMLVASYVFVAFYGDARHTAASFRYLSVNVLGSALMLLAVGGLYAVTGTLNMADMSRRLADPTTYGIDLVPVVGLSAILLAVFALKAGLVPFQFWVPAAYTAAPLPVTAMFAGVTKKVGIYAIVRLYFTVFADAATSIDLPWIVGESPLVFLAPVLAAMGVASILVGGFGAIDRDTLDGLFAYSSIGQVGFIAIPVAIAAGAESVPSGTDPTGTLRGIALAAALVYALHHALAKVLLFFAAAAIADATGTTRFSDLGGIAGRAPVLAGSFFVGTLSLIGLPPLTGFFGKFVTFEVVVRDAAAEPDVGAVVVLVTMLVGALLTILYGTRAWSESFWGVETSTVEAATFDARQVAIVVALAALILGLGIGFDPIYGFAETAASAAIDSDAYIDVVDPLEGGEYVATRGGEPT